MTARDVVDGFAADIRRGFADDRPLAIYGRLVHASIEGAFRSMFPRTTARLGDRIPDEIRRFLRDHAPTTHYVRDAPLELVRHRLAAWTEDTSFPPFFVDLARHDVTFFEAATAEDGPDPTGEPLDLGAPIAFLRSTRIFAASHAVHLLEHDDEDGTPDPREVRLLLYRDAEHQVRTLELSPVAHAVLGELLAGATLGDAVVRGATKAGEAVTEALLERTSTLLAEGFERGYVLGRAASAGAE